MSDSSEQITSVINNACQQKIQALADEYASRFISYIRYEFVIAQMELASSWEKHGYNFKYMPEQFIQNIRVSQINSDGLNQSIRVTVPSENFKGEDEEKVKFFQEYVIDNAALKMQTIK